MTWLTKGEQHNSDRVHKHLAEPDGLVVVVFAVPEGDKKFEHTVVFDDFEKLAAWNGRMPPEIEMQFRLVKVNKPKYPPLN